MPGITKETINNTGTGTSPHGNTALDSGIDDDTGSMTSVELENRLLKNEVSQLHQEMSSVIQRAREAQDGRQTRLEFLEL